MKNMLSDYESATMGSSSHSVDTFNPAGIYLINNIFIICLPAFYLCVTYGVNCLYCHLFYYRKFILRRMIISLFLRKHSVLGHN